MLCMAIFVVESNLKSAITDTYKEDLKLSMIYDQWQQNTIVVGYQLLDRLLRRKGRIVIGPGNDVRRKIMSWVTCCTREWTFWEGTYFEKSESDILVERNDKGC